MKRARPRLARTQRQDPRPTRGLVRVVLVLNFLTANRVIQLSALHDELPHHKGMRRPTGIRSTVPRRPTALRGLILMADDAGLVQVHKNQVGVKALYDLSFTLHIPDTRWVRR